MAGMRIAAATPTRADAAEDWPAVLEFWFPPGLDDADAATHRRAFEWWFQGGSNAALPRFAPLLDAAKAGRLDHWRAAPSSRLALILVLDQFPRGLFAGTPDAYASDPEALAVAEEGLRNGHHAALARPWEKLFSAMPLAHAEGPDHLRRLARVVRIADALVAEAPERLRTLYRFSAAQARGHRDVVARFGRYPHRNRVLGRATTAKEESYLATSDFVHTRRPPEG